MAGMQQADLLQERPETERSKFAMKCYHCDCELTDQDTCPTCGADVALYKKLMSLSNLSFVRCRLSTNAAALWAAFSAFITANIFFVFWKSQISKLTFGEKKLSKVDRIGE